jgi:hypothetical protein
VQEDKNLYDLKSHTEEHIATQRFGKHLSAEAKAHNYRTTVFPVVRCYATVVAFNTPLQQ